MAVSEKRRAQLKAAAERYRRNHPDRRAKSLKSYKQKGKGDRPIIAIDSEGVNVNGKHELVLIGFEGTDIDGEYLSARGGKGISTRKILDELLLPAHLEHPSAIFIGFGFSYDARMILRDVSRLEWLAIKTGNTTKILNRRYQVTKSKNRISITFLKEPSTPCITIYDTLDFFGSSFLVAIEKYLAPNFTEADEESFKTVKEGKLNREYFKLEDFDEILDYWISEIGFMHRLIETVRDSLYRNLGIMVTEWDVLTPLTNKMLDRHDAKLAMQDAPEWVPVDEAFLGARIEPFYCGHVGESVYDYDLNGAYGDALRHLPNLVTGEWVKIEGKDFDWTRDYKQFGIYEVEYENWDVGSIEPQPLPVRKHGKYLFFPVAAHTFVWGPEAWMTRQDTKLICAWVYQDDGTRPLKNLANELWEIRIHMQEENDACEKMVKQVLARMVGKFCQNVGTVVDYLSGEVLKTPRFRQLEYAGFLTSYTRARLYQAMRVALNKGGRVFNCNTDGFASDVDISTELQKLHGFGDGMGQWKSRRYMDMIIVDTNVSLLQEFPIRDKEWVVKKSGFGQGYKVTYEEVMEELSRDDIWDKEYPMVFKGKMFDDEGMEWLEDYKIRHLGGKGKRLHTRNCRACHAGLPPSDAPHSLSPRS